MLQEAYGVLSGAASRSAYDRVLAKRAKVRRQRRWRRCKESLESAQGLAAFALSRIATRLGGLGSRGGGGWSEELGRWLSAGLGESQKLLTGYGFGLPQWRGYYPFAMSLLAFILI